MLALQGGKILTVARGIIDKGTILIEHDKIAALGENISVPDGTTIIRTNGKVIAPGMIDCHTHLGIAVEGVGEYGNDRNEANFPAGSHLRALDGINPADEGLRDARCGGITAVIVTPGSENAIGGLSVAIKTAGRVIDNMVLRHPAGLKVAFGENPKKKAARQQNGYPSTRMGVAALIREQFSRGENYLKKRECYRSDAQDFLDRDLGMEAVTGVLKGYYPLRAHVHAAEDIMTAIRIADEFGIALILEHATEGHRVVEEIARRNIPCSIGPTLTARVKVELKDRQYDTPAILHKAGVEFALITDHPILPVNCLRMEALQAIINGLPAEAALRAITLDAAKIMGAADRIGSLEPGKDADIVVWSGDPFDLNALVERVFINGKQVYLHSSSAV